LVSGAIVNGNIPTCGWYPTSHLTEGCGRYGITSRVRDDILEGVKNVPLGCASTSMDMRGMIASWLQTAEVKSYSQHFTL
jgi:hypothetical protein